MKPILKKGQLISWKDDRGFGFIKPEEGGKDVFLHISAVKTMSRRPKVGDIILYERVAEADGKIRAAKASIQGVTVVSNTRKTARKSSLLKTVVNVAIMAGIGFFTIEFTPSRFPLLITSITKPGCNIKGNISIETDNKIYHLSGMEDYDSTVIDQTKGEKWFCTESEAIASGWRKAPR